MNFSLDLFIFIILTGKDSSMNTLNAITKPLPKIALVALCGAARGSQRSQQPRPRPMKHQMHLSSPQQRQRNNKNKQAACVVVKLLRRKKRRHKNK